jgi:amphi-Trp domain-containing protein
MGKETRLFKSEEPKSRADVGAFLRQLADKLDSGEVILRQGAEELILTLPHDLILEIQVEDEEKSRGTQHSLEIEIKWYDNGGPGGPLALG